jgi:enoyl-CoA hydratase/carnithine racemase
MATARPSAASFSAIPRPIPRAAPLTKATLFTGRGYTALCRLPEEDDLDYETLIYEQDEHVVTLTYNRPDQHNAVNRKMNSELHHAWQRFRDDDHAFVLVITGAGSTTFCAGWDLGDAAALSKMPDFDEYRTSMYNSPGECGYTRRADVFKPVIAAVNGYAFAAGLETALLADIRIAAENAEFGALERRWNIVGGDGMTVRLPLVVGFARAMEMIITGRRVDVREAERIGLVNEVVPKGKALERAQELAREIAALPQGAIRSDKESVMRGIGRTLEERLRIEAEMTISMFLRKDSHTIGAGGFKKGLRDGEIEWPNHGL